MIYLLISIVFIIIAIFDQSYIWYIISAMYAIAAGLFYIGSCIKNKK